MNASRMPIPPEAAEALVETVCVHIAAVLDRDSDRFRSDQGFRFFAPAARSFVGDHAPAILGHLLSPLSKAASGELASDLIPDCNGTPMRLFVHESFRRWRLEREDSSIEAAGTSPFSLLELVLPNHPAETPWLQIVGLAALLAMEALKAEAAAPAGEVT